MEIKERYTIELTSRGDAELAAAAAAKRLAGDSQLAANEKQRKGNTKFEKMWSVAAGLMLVIAFILYACYLTIPSLILIGILVVYLVFTGIYLRSQRNKKESAEHEISPRRSLDAMVRRALGMEVTGRDATAFMNAGEISEFGNRLRGAVSAVTAAKIDSVSTAVTVIDVEAVSDILNIIPAEITVSAGETEVVLSWKVPFAIAPTGDCVPADANPAFGEAVKTEVKKKKI